MGETWISVTSSVEESEVFGWSRSRIPSNTGSRNQIFLSDSGYPVGSCFTSRSQVGNSCWNGTISFETFVETEISCCAPRFPLILTFKFNSLCVKGLESEILGRSESGAGVGNFGNSESEIGKVGVGSRIFYLRLRNPGYKLKMHRGIDGMFAFSSGLRSWINKDSRICGRRQLQSLPMTSGLLKSTWWSGLAYKCLQTDEISEVRCSSIRVIKLRCDWSM